MPVAMSPPTDNGLIDDLPRSARNLVVQRCETVDLPLGAVLGEAGKPIRHVYFPLSGCISQCVSVGGHPPLELGLTGREGMLGLTLLLGVAKAPMQAVVMAAGVALRMPSAALLECVDASPALKRVLARHLYLLLGQLARTAACTGFHDVDARLAHFLLLSHDRARADHFHFTHEMLADMLGVQRSAVTIAAGQMQKARLISYSRGEINILDRAGLEAVSCECYLVAAVNQARLVPAPRAGVAKASR